MTDYYMITAASNCPGYSNRAIFEVWIFSRGQARGLYNILGVEFSKYNIELVDLVDFRYYLNSTQLSDDRLNRSTRSISWSMASVRHVEF